MKKLILFMAICSISFISCEKEDYYDGETSEKSTSRYISFDQFKMKSSAFAKFQKANVNHRGDVMFRGNGADSLEGFSLDLQRIREINAAGKTTFTFTAYENKANSNNDLINLIFFEIKPNVFDFFILRYSLSEDDKIDIENGIAVNLLNNAKIYSFDVYSQLELMLMVTVM